MNSISYLNKKKYNINNAVVVYPFTYVNPYSVFPPIAAEYLQAGIVETGRRAILLDMRFETDIREHLDHADLVCIYGFFEDCSIFGKWNIHVIPEILEAVPPDTPVIVGGTGLNNPDQVMKSYPKVDIVIRGNPEKPIMEILQKGTPENVGNVSYRKGNEVVFTHRTIHKLPDHIYPRRNLRNPKYYYHSMGVQVDLIRASVGCNYACTFCYQYGKDFDGNFMRWQGRSARSLLHELQEIDAPFVGWIDDDMTNDMKTLEELADMLLEKNVKKLYGGTGRIDHVMKSSVDALKKLEKAGFLAFSFGIESLKNDTLKFYRKGLTLDSIEKGMSQMRRTNILLFCNFVLGSPGETEKDIMDMLWFSRRWNVDTAVTNRFRVQKPSLLYNRIYNADTGTVKPGMERIEGKKLDRLKYKIKFGQRTPGRILLTLLKLYRHKGMFIDPFYILLCFLETTIKHTWPEKRRVVPLLFKIVKKFLLYSPVRYATRTMAIAITPFIRGMNFLFESADRKLGISTSMLPRIFLYLKDRIYKKQPVKVQAVTKSVPG